MLLTCGSCIEPFEPDILETREVLVINGMITDTPGMHYIEISRSAPYDEPAPAPVEGCVVNVIDENGAMVSFLEEASGRYGAYIPGSFLAVGKAYSLQVIAPDQQEYRSDYDTLLACPPIDTVYYKVESRETSDPDLPVQGIQFYLDLEGSSADSKNFMWQLEETWEYHAAHIGKLTWWGNELRKEPTYDIFKCWEHYPIMELFTASTRNLSGYDLKGFPLHFVSNKTDRLKIRYDLLVKQQSLSRSAYAYWEKMKTQSTETGGLYETQPSSTIGNLYNTGDPDEVVLGIFYATQERQRRFTIADQFEFEIPSITCELETITDVTELGSDYPYYLISIGIFPTSPPYLTADQYCFDCRIKGGTNIKPDYW